MTSWVQEWHKPTEDLSGWQTLDFEYYERATAIANIAIASVAIANMVGLKSGWARVTSETPEWVLDRGPLDV